MRGSGFFEGIHQVDLEIGGEPGKSPAFYYDGAYIQAVFPARLARLRQLMPDSRYIPARLGPGLGAVAVSCFEYRDTDIGAYNEIAIAAVLIDPPFTANIPGRALLDAFRRHAFHVYVMHLPVTTEVALRGGVDNYGFPKTLARIEFPDAGNARLCRFGQGEEHVFTLAGPKLPTAPGDVEDLFAHLWMDGQPQTGQFKVNRLALARAVRTADVSLELGGRHPIAIELKQLLVSKRPIFYEYVPQMEGILFGPEHLTLPLVKRSLEAIEAVHRHPVIS